MTQQFISQNKLKKITAIFCCFMFLLSTVIFFIPAIASAQEVDLGLEYGTAIGLTTTDIRVLVANIIRIALGLIGIVFVGLIIYAGWLWMSSQGDPEKVGSAKKLMINGAIGLAIILSAFAITTFILNSLIGTTTGSGVGSSFNNAGGNGFGGGAYGSGTIQSHYPERDQTDVPRNTSIAITFKVPYDPETIIIENTGDDILGNCDGEVCDLLNTQNIKIYQLTDDLIGPNGALYTPDDQTDVLTNINALTTDQKTFVFVSQELLGSPNEPTQYAVYLTDNVCQPAIDGSPYCGFGTEDEYGWLFEIGTDVDFTPPVVVDVVPVPASTVDKNHIVQIIFNEAISPLTSTGAVSEGFDRVAVYENQVSADNIVTGYFEGAINQYRTIEFVSDELCGQNSCGNDVFCLPEDANIFTLIKAASVGSIPPQATFLTTGVADGIFDMAFNSLDGNEDGEAVGHNVGQYHDLNNPLDNPSFGDSVIWNFTTTDQINLEPPRIDGLFPDNGDDQLDGVELNTPVDITFNKPMQGRYLNQGNLFISNWTRPYWISFDLINENGVDKTTASINHSDFDTNSNYAPVVTSNVQDVYQNCFVPCRDQNNCVAGNCETGDCVQTGVWDGDYPNCQRN